MKGRILILAIYLLVACSSFKAGTPSNLAINGPLLERSSLISTQGFTDACSFGQTQWLLAGHPSGFSITKWDGITSSREVIPITDTDGSFIQTTQPSFSCVSTTDVWVYDNQLITIHWDGNSWQKRTIFPITLVAVSSSEIWYLSKQHLYKGDGTFWEEQTIPNNHIVKLWGDSQQLWVQTDLGKIFRKEGSLWKEYSISDDQVWHFFSMLFTPNGDSWAVGQQTDVSFINHTRLLHLETKPGSSEKWWKIVAILPDNSYPFLGIDPTGKLWIGSDIGVNHLTIWDGAFLTPVPIGTYGGILKFWTDTLGNFWALPKTTSYGSSGGPLFLLENGVWRNQTPKLHNVSTVTQLFVIDPDNVWLVGQNSLTVQVKGGKAQFYDNDLGWGYDLYDVWARNANDVWAIGEGILHYTGKDKWESVTNVPGSLSYSASFIKVTGNESELWAINTQNTVFGLANGTWQNWVIPGIGSSNGICSMGVNDTWVLQSNGLWHWQGVNWQHIPSPLDDFPGYPYEDKLVCTKDHQLWVVRGQRQQWVNWDGKTMHSWQPATNFYNSPDGWGDISTQLWFIGNEQVAPTHKGLYSQGSIAYFHDYSWSQWISNSNQSSVVTEYLSIHGSEHPWVLARSVDDNTKESFYLLLEWSY